MSQLPSKKKNLPSRLTDGDAEGGQPRQRPLIREPTAPPSRVSPAWRPGKTLKTAPPPPPLFPSPPLSARQSLVGGGGDISSSRAGGLDAGLPPRLGRGPLVGGLGGGAQARLGGSMTSDEVVVRAPLGRRGPGWW
jgi:hypothetical protein